MAEQRHLNWRRLGRLAGVGYLVWCGLLFFLQDLLVFPTHLLPKATPRPADPRVRVWQLPVGDGAVVAWFAPHPTASATAPKPAVVFCHGNGEVIANLGHVVAAWHELGCSVLLPEYRGYGGCAGRPSERALIADARGFVALLARQPEVDPRRIVYHGRSLGGGVATGLAEVAPPAALILVSTFDNLSSLAPSYGVPPLLVRNPFRTDRRLPRLACPALLIHGTHDRLVPVAKGRRLHALVPTSQWLELPAGHNDLPRPEQRELFWGTVREFLDAASGR